MPPSSGRSKPAATSGLVRSARLFDVYKPQPQPTASQPTAAAGERSLAVRLELLDGDEATLTDEQHRPGRARRWWRRLANASARACGAEEGRDTMSDDDLKEQARVLLGSLETPTLTKARAGRTAVRASSA